MRLKNSSTNTTSVSSSWLIIQVSNLQVLENLLLILPLVLFLPAIIGAFKKTPDFQSGDELNAHMSSSLRRGNRGLKSVEDVIKRMRIERPPLVVVRSILLLPTIAGRKSKIVNQKGELIEDG